MKGKIIQEAKIALIYYIFTLAPTYWRKGLHKTKAGLSAFVFLFLKFIKVEKIKINLTKIYY